MGVRRSFFNCHQNAAQGAGWTGTHAGKPPCAGFDEQHVIERLYEQLLRSCAAANLPGYIFQRISQRDGSSRIAYFSGSYWRMLGFEHAEEAGNANSTLLRSGMALPVMG